VALILGIRVLPPAEPRSARFAFGLLVIELLDIGLLFGRALEVRVQPFRTIAKLTAWLPTKTGARSGRRDPFL
jgi:hypothetical protein